MPTPRTRLGTRGEKIAGLHLQAQGYEILATNFRCQWGEVDIVARDGACLVFVEVRTRRNTTSFGTPEESLSKKKRDRLVATAETYIQDCCDSPPEGWRIDLVTVRLDRLTNTSRLNQIENAVELE